MSDSNLANLYLGRESAFDEAPAGTLTLVEQRFVSENLNAIKETEDSEEVRDDRSIRDILEVGLGANGGFTAEFISEAYDQLLEAAVCAAWVTGTESTVSCDIDESAETITRLAGSFSTAQQRAKWIKVAGATNSTNNGIKRVVSMTSTVITLAAGSLTDDESTVSLDFTHNYTRNGVTLFSHYMELQYTSHATDYFRGFRGMCVNAVTLNLAAKKKAMVTFDFLGARGYKPSPMATGGDGSPTAASNNPVCTVGAHVGAVLLDGVASAANLLKVDLRIGNGLRERPAVGSLPSAEFGLNRFDVGGQLNAYFSNGTLYEAFFDNTGHAIHIPLTDSDGKVTAFDLPKVKFFDANPNIGAVDTDIMAPANFRALKSAETSEGYIVQVDALTP